MATTTSITTTYAESVGDFIDIWSDGSGWYVWGIGSAAGSITATDPS